MKKNSYNSRALIKNMPTAFSHHKVIFDENKNPINYIFLDINKKFEEITGLKEEEVINKKATEVLDNITNESFNWIEFYGNLSLNGGSETFEEYSNELKRWYKVQAYSQQEGYFTTLFNDITKKIKKEKKLKEMSKRVNDIFNNINDVVWSMSWPDLEINFISKAVEDLVGYTIDDFQQDPLLIQKITHPEDRHINIEAVKRLKETGFIEREFRIICKDGSLKWVQDRGEMVYDEENRPIKVEGVMRDITKRKKAENKMESNKEKYKTIFNSSPLGIILENKKGEIIEANKMMTKMSGYSKEELEGSSVFEKFVLPEKKEEARENIKEIIEKDKEIEYETKTKVKNGEIRSYYLNETSIYLPNGEKGLISMQLDITERKQKEKQIKYLLYRDQLTDLYNRRFFEEKMESLNQKSKLPISIIMADVNGLKIINDTYGHSTGDELLVKTAELLKESIRPEDILARWAGDEFVILLPQTKREKAEQIMTKIKSTNKELSKENIPISIGMGVATKNNMTNNITKVLEKADDKMYQNKLSESRSANNKIVQNLLNTLGTKSSETKEHAIRMTNLAHQLGKELELSNSEMNKLSLLATLHDIGKTTISEDILIKPGKLNEKEWNIMKEHPERGYKIASASEEFVLVAEEILFHHEHWDGSGYPKGLKGNEIPYLSRIISIIDAYDVMTHKRPYSEAISNEKALAEIKDCVGTQFDPKLSRKFIKLKK